MRITGLATGLDMDEIVKNSMKPYRIKIDKKGQDKEILEIKQKLYREVIKDSREFYNKYFDVTKSDSLLLSRNWATTKFSSSNENVLTVSSSGDAKVENYTITGTVAKSSKLIIPFEAVNGETKAPEKIIINGKEFTLKGDNEKEKALNLNSDLKVAGINVKVAYTDFAGVDGVNNKGYILESTILGRDSNFTVGGSIDTNISILDEKSYESATAADISGFKIANLNLDGENKFEINEKELILNLNSKDFVDENIINKDKLKEILNSKLKEYNLEIDINEDDSLVFKSTKLGVIDEIALTLNNSLGEVKGSFLNGENEEKASKTFNLSDFENKKILINDVLIDLYLKDGDALTTKDDMTTVDYLNKVLKSQNINITVTEAEVGKLTFTSNNKGEDAKIEIGLLGGDYKLSEGGVDAKVVFTNSKGGVYTHEGTSNVVTLDGVTFKFNGEIPKDTTINVNGKNDVTDIKDKLVNFINDYNKLVEKLNTLTTEKRNRDFDPLTADQKKEMSEDEIKFWNEKVEKGQLSRDIDLTRISNSLKETMRTLVDGSGLILEKIGISPVKDYAGTKNGTYTIDEEKLTKALEENSQEVMNLFTKSAPKNESLSSRSKYEKTGIMYRLKDILYNETVTSSSALLKKVGYEGTVTAYNNTLTKSIKEYEQKMSDMEKDFSRREQALYSKYANLESIMNKYNSQQSYLTQQLGLG